MADQIRSAMSEPVAEADGARASFVFGADFVGFQGHFPGRRILPAVCNVEAALILLEAHFHRKVKLRELERARFSAPATSDERLEVRCVIAEREGGERLVRATVSRGDATIARFRLRVLVEGVDD